MLFRKKESRYLDGDDDEDIVKKNKWTTKKILYIVIPIISVIVIGIAVLQIVRTQMGYQEAEGEYSSLSQYVTIQDEPEVTAEPELTYEIEEIPYFPVVDVDEDALKAVSEDYECWFYFPLLDLSYPVAKCLNNDYYLHHTLEGKYNNAGCLFIDYVNEDDLKDKNTFIYGHNMRDGTMFGNLDVFEKDDKLVDLDPHIYLYMGGKVYIYSIFSYYITETADYAMNPDEDRFRLIADKSIVDADEDYIYITYDEYLEKAKKLSLYEPVENLDFSEEPPMITLSTCYGPYGATKRFLVHAVQTGIYDLP